VRDGRYEAHDPAAQRNPYSTIMILFAAKAHPQTAARVPRDVAHGRILAGIGYTVNFSVADRRGPVCSPLVALSSYQICLSNPR